MRMVKYKIDYDGLEKIYEEIRRQVDDKYEKVILVDEAGWRWEFNDIDDALSTAERAYLLNMENFEPCQETPDGKVCYEECSENENDCDVDISFYLLDSSDGDYFIGSEGFNQIGWEDSEVRIEVIPFNQ